MEPSRSACIVLVVVFLALIGVEPAVQAVHDVQVGQRPSALEIFTRTPTAEHLRAYEGGLSEQSFLANAVRPWLQYWRFSVMSDAGKNGLIGRDGWLFYKPGVQFLVQPWGASEQPEDPMEAILSFREQLYARGIHLLLLITPGKESVYPMQLTARADSRVNGHVETFLGALRKNGVDVVYAGLGSGEVMAAPDATPGGPAYLAQDTHWTPARARKVAEDVADLVVEKGWVQTGNAAYDEREVSLDRYGDILRMAKSEPLQRAQTPEHVTCWQVIEPSTGERYKDAPDSPVLVLGDSFLRIFQADEPMSAGFIAHLARALRMPVTSIVNDGGASTLVRQELRRKPELLIGKKLVVWEFVERDLRFGTDGWKDIQLSAQ